MSREQVSITELLLSLDSPELLQVEKVRAELNHLLTTDRGGGVVSSLVEYYLDTSSSQAVVLLSSIREPHHKILLEKLNESLNRPGSRLECVTLLGHLVRKQPPWVHQISRSPLLSTLLRCLKTDAEVLVLVPALLVLITLLPMIPQAGKQHIYDFFDVFGHLTSWSYKNPGRVPAIYLLHLRASVYSLFHRLYGMFPCSFMSYLRLHYSLKENLDTFREVVKPMLGLVRVHPQLVSGTQDYELDPSRWRSYEVHDIVMECSRLSLDPLESSCEDDILSFFREARPTSLGPPPPASPLPPLSSGSPTSAPSGSRMTVNTTLLQDDVTWSPSSLCGLATPPPEHAGGNVPPTPAKTSQPEQVSRGQQVEEQEAAELTCTLVHEPTSPAQPVSLGFSPGSSASLDQGYAHGPQSPKLPHDALFELALPHTTALFIRRKTKEILQKEGLEEEKGGGSRMDSCISPLEVLDQLIVCGHDAHESLSRRLSAATRTDRSHSGGKQQSTRKGPTLGEELQSARGQLLLLHSQLLYERFKRQQHAVRNRRLLRRVVNTTALEECSVAMKAQMLIEEEEIEVLKKSLDEEQRRYTHLQQETHTHTHKLQTHIQQLLQQQQEKHRDSQRLQAELGECNAHLRAVEAELQTANQKAHSAESQLTRLTLKLETSEQLQQQNFLLNQQLILLKQTNQRLTEELEGHPHTPPPCCKLCCCEGAELWRLTDSELQQRQRLEAANQRAAEAEQLLAQKEQNLLKLKKLLEASRNRSRVEVAACEGRCAALISVCQTLQAEMLQLYAQVERRAQPIAALHADALSSPEGGDGGPSRRSGQASTPPSRLPSFSPLESPITPGSFLEQRVWQSFRLTNRSQPEEPEYSELQPSPPPPPPPEQEAVESLLLQKGATPPPAETLQMDVLRRRELSIMDYDETVVTSAL